jgi:hypothetical protein
LLDGVAQVKLQVFASFSKLMASDVYCASQQLMHGTPTGQQIWRMSTHRRIAPGRRRHMDMPYHETGIHIEANRLQQYEIVWIRPEQYPPTDDGFGLEIRDFLGPGDPDPEGWPTIWVRGPIVEAVTLSGGVRLVRGEYVTVAIPHNQPRARRTGGWILPQLSTVDGTA